MQGENVPSRTRARDLIELEPPAAPHPDPKVVIAISKVDSDQIDQVWVQQDPPRRYARRQHITLTIAQAKELRALLGRKIEDAERRNAVAKQRRSP